MSRFSGDATALDLRDPANEVERQSNTQSNETTVQQTTNKRQSNEQLVCGTEPSFHVVVLTMKHEKLHAKGIPATPWDI